MDWLSSLRHFLLFSLVTSSLTSSMTNNLENVASRSLRRLYGDHALGPSGRLRIEMPLVPPFVRILRKEYKKGPIEDLLPMVVLEQPTLENGGLDWNVTTTLATLREGYGDLEVGFEYSEDGEDLPAYVDYYGVMERSNGTTPVPNSSLNETIGTVVVGDTANVAETTAPTEGQTMVVEPQNPTTEDEIDQTPTLLEDGAVGNNDTSQAEIETERSTNEDEEVTINESNLDSKSKDPVTTTPIPRMPKLLFEIDKGNETDDEAIRMNTVSTTSATPSVVIPQIPIPTSTVKPKIPPMVRGDKWRPSKTMPTEVHGRSRTNSPGNGGGLFQSILNMAREKTKLINTTFTQLASVLLGINSGSQKTMIEDRRQHYS